MKIKQAVHLPELSLSCGGLRCFGRTQRARMAFHEWEVSMNQTHAVQQFTSHLLGGPMSLLTAWTPVVAIIVHYNRRIRWPHHVVALGHRHRQRSICCFTHL